MPDDFLEAGETSEETSETPIVGENEEVTEEEVVTEERKIAMYMAGRKVLVTEGEKTRYEELLNELEDAQKGRELQNIPLGDVYYAKKSELDAYTAGF